MADQDYDDKLMQDALAEMTPEERNEMAESWLDDPSEKGEEKAEAAPEPPAPSGDGKTSAEEPSPEPVAEAPAIKAENPMIPKARFDEVNGKKIEAERYAAYLEGKVEALTKGGSTQGEAAPPPQQKDRVAELTATAENLDKRYEDGEISTVDYMKESRKISSDLAKAEAETVLSQVNVQRASLDDMRLDELTRELDQLHPYLFELSEAQFKFLTQEARTKAAQAGQPVDTTTARGVFELRKAVAELSDTLGPVLTGKQIQVPGRAQPAVAGQPQPTPGMSPQAQARAAKLDLQGRMPPNINQIGTAAGPTGLTAERILSMAKDDPNALENLPAEELDRLSRS